MKIFKRMILKGDELVEMDFEKVYFYCCPGCMKVVQDCVGTPYTHCPYCGYPFHGLPAVERQFFFSEAGNKGE